MRFSASRALLGPSHLDLSLILRGFFALAVLYWHVIGAYAVDTLPIAFNIPGRVAVWFFFGISGYVIFLGYFSGNYRLDFRGIKDFWIKRIGRIFPLFWFLSLLAIGTIWLQGAPQKLSGWEYFIDLFALKISHAYALNGIFWTLGIELHFYLIAPLIVCLLFLQPLKLFRNLTILYVLLLFVFGIQPDLRSMIGNLHYFLAGGLIAYTRHKNWLVQISQNPTNQFALAFLGCLFLLGANAAYHLKLLGWFVSCLATNASLICLLALHVGLEEKRIHASFIIRALHVFGVLSYGIYAWHGYILNYHSNLIQGFGPIFLLSFLAAFFSYVWIEYPSIRLSRRFTVKAGALERKQ